MNGDLFVYGTLMFPAVIEALIGRIPRQQPATLPGYRRYRLVGEVFPAIAAAPSAHVDGTIYRDLSADERALLDAFESSVYIRLPVEAYTPRETVTADAYVLDRRHERLLEPTPAWSLDEFAARSGGRYVQMCAAFRTRWRPTAMRSNTRR